MVWSELGSAAAEAAVITAMPSAVLYADKGDRDPQKEAKRIVNFMLPAGGAAMGALAGYHMSDAKKPKGALGRAATEAAIGGVAIGGAMYLGGKLKLHRPWVQDGKGMPWSVAASFGVIAAGVGTVGLYVGHLAVDAALARK